MFATLSVLPMTALGLVFVGVILTGLGMLARTRMLWLGCFTAAIVVGWPAMIPELEAVQVFGATGLILVGFVAAVVTTWPACRNRDHRDSSQPSDVVVVALEDFGGAFEREGARAQSGPSFAWLRRILLGVFRAVLWGLASYLLLFSMIFVQGCWDGMIWGARIPEYALWSKDSSVTYYLFYRSNFPDGGGSYSVCQRWGLWRYDIGPSWAVPGLIEPAPDGTNDWGGHRVELNGLEGQHPRVWIDGEEGGVVKLRTNTN